MFTLLVPIWKRPKLTERVINYYKKRQKKFGFRLVVVGSEDDDYGKKMGVDYVHSDNYPVSRKWTNGAKGCIDPSSEGILMAGSDNYMSDELLTYIGGLKGDTEYCLQWRECYFYRCSDRKLSLWSSGKMGVGRFFSRAALEKVDYTLFTQDTKENNALDHHVHTHFRSHGVEWINNSLFDIDAYIIDVKYSDNLSPHAITDAGPVRDVSILPTYIQQELVILNKLFDQEPKEEKVKRLNLNGMQLITAIQHPKSKMTPGRDYEVSDDVAEILINKGMAHLKGQEPKKVEPKSEAPKRKPRAKKKA